MGVKLVSSGGGSVEINPPATASSFIATMPAGTGNVVVNGVNGALVLGTAQNSTSGTSIDFTGIPSWVRRITVLYNQVSTNGSSNPLVQIGAGSVATSGYFSAAEQAGSRATSAAGFILMRSIVASDFCTGAVVISTLGSNTWVATGIIAPSVTSTNGYTSGVITLGGVLDRVRITTVNGTDAFDGGVLNIMYE